MRLSRNYSFADKQERTVGDVYKRQVENGNVNIMFSGHTHLYSRYASADPKRGADTLYVTQGDARIGGGKIDTGKPDQRLDDNYPNLLATRCV